MGLISSRETTAQSSSTSPTHNNADDLATALAGTAISSNVTPTTTIKRTTSPSKSLHNWKTPQQLQNHHVRQASVRSRAATPMPDHSELDKRFAKVLVRSVFIFFFDFPFQISIITMSIVACYL